MIGEATYTSTDGAEVMRQIYWLSHSPKSGTVCRSVGWNAGHFPPEAGKLAKSIQAEWYHRVRAMPNVLWWADWGSMHISL